MSLLYSHLSFLTCAILVPQQPSWGADGCGGFLVVTTRRNGFIEDHHPPPPPPHERCDDYVLFRFSRKFSQHFVFVPAKMSLKCNFFNFCNDVTFHENMFVSTLPAYHFPIGIPWFSFLKCFHSRIPQSQSQKHSIQRYWYNSHKDIQFKDTGITVLKTLNSKIRE